MSNPAEFRLLTDDVDHGVVRAAEELLPLLREHAAEAERLRRLPSATVEALEKHGLTRLTTPKRFGGLQVNLPTEFEVVRTIAKACGSTSWVVALYALCGYWASLFPDAVQEEVFSGPDARVAGISTPAGTLTPTDGGYVLNGQWPWNTGVLDATWNVLATLRPHEDGSMEPYLVLVPTSAMTTLDDWHTSAMQGTGSVTSVASNVFVPVERALSFPPLLGGHHASEANRDRTEYSYAVYPFLLAASLGTPIGMAQGALAAFLDRAPKRSASFEDPRPQSASPVAHLLVGEISLTIESALAIARNTIAGLHQHAIDGSEVSVRERVEARAAVAYATRLSAQAATDDDSIGGASAIRLDAVSQRQHRDVTMLANHALLNYEANVALLGSVISGNEPETVFL
jgi:3-hydroxy-9,10-secoandrosta-1,3,5(10)-triene-9,17-dione monooxygenase